MRELSQPFDNTDGIVDGLDQEVRADGLESPHQFPFLPHYFRVLACILGVHFH
jgi:hypothetical protein